MNIIQMNSTYVPRCEVSSVEDLLNLYNGTMEELRKCADVDPASDEDMTASDRREAALLDLEADLLVHAARIQIRSKTDVQILMDMWSKVSGYELGGQSSASDRIAMNLFRHISDAQFSKA